MLSSFMVMPRLLDPTALNSIHDLMLAEHSAGKAYPGQTGIHLQPSPLLAPLLVLDEVCSTVLGKSVRLRTDRSSCRRQAPDGHGRLTLHQDKMALSADNPSEARMVAWVPLCDIDDETPTLEVCPIDLDCFLKHRKNEIGYSILEKDPGLPMVALTKLCLGDVVLMRSTTLHGTYVRPWHTKTRISLDLRFFPAA